MSHILECKKIKDQIIIYDIVVKERKVNIFSKIFVTDKWLNMQNWTVLYEELTNITKDFLSRVSYYNLKKVYIKELPGDLSLKVVFKEINPAIKVILKLDNYACSHYLSAVVEHKISGKNMQETSKSTFIKETFPPITSTSIKESLSPITLTNKSTSIKESLSPITLTNKHTIERTRTYSKEYSPTRHDFEKSSSYTPSPPFLTKTTQKLKYIPTPKHQQINPISEYIPQMKNSDDDSISNIFYTPTKINKTNEMISSNNEVFSNCEEKIDSNESSTNPIPKRSRKSSSKTTDSSTHVNVTKRKKNLHEELFESDSNSSKSPVQEKNSNEFHTKDSPTRVCLPRKSKPVNLKETKVTFKELQYSKKKSKKRERKLPSISEKSFKKNKVKGNIFDPLCEDLFANLECMESPNISIQKEETRDNYLGKKEEEHLNCKHLSLDKILEYFKEIQEKLFLYLKEYCENKNYKVKHIQDIHYLVVHDLLTETQLAYMHDILMENCNLSNVDVYNELAYLKLMPEWCLEMFISEHGKTRKESAEYLSNTFSFFNTYQKINKNTIME